MPIVNGSFEDRAPGREGLAAGWSLASSAALVRVAGFGAPPFGLEGFGWGGAFPPLASSFALAIFDALGEAREDFSEGWHGSRTGYYVELSGGLALEAEIDGGSREAFGWDGDPWFSLWSELPGARVGEAPSEAIDLAGYVTSWGQVGEDPASFDGAVEREDFSDFTEI